MPKKVQIVLDNHEKKFALEFENSNDLGEAIAYLQQVMNNWKFLPAPAKKQPWGIYRDRA